MEGREAKGFCLRYMFYKMWEASPLLAVRVAGVGWGPEKKVRAVWSRCCGEWALGDLPGSSVCIVMLFFSFMGRRTTELEGMPMAGDWHAAVCSQAGLEPSRVLAK